IGFPVMIKPTSGMEGVGVMWVNDDESLDEAWNAAVAATTEAFGPDTFVVERAIRTARHLELTVARDRDGGEFVSGERESRIGGGGRAMLLESPSPIVLQHASGIALRAILADRVIRFAREIDLVGMATVEFLVDHHDVVWFLEANGDEFDAL